MLQGITTTHLSEIGGTVQEYQGGCELFEAGKKICACTYHVVNTGSDIMGIQFCVLEMNGISSAKMIRILRLAAMAVPLQIALFNGKIFDIQLAFQPSGGDYDNGYLKFDFEFMKWYVDFKLVEITEVVGILSIKRFRREEFSFVDFNR